MYEVKRDVVLNLKQQFDELFQRYVKYFGILGLNNLVPSKVKFWQSFEYLGMS